MAPIRSTTYAQATKGKQYEETSDVHDGSPPFSGNSRILSHRARQGGANKSAYLSQTFFSCPVVVTVSWSARYAKLHAQEAWLQ
jgi:hypothetical protein